MYPMTKAYIFSEIGKRIKKRKKEKKITYYQLAGYKNKKDYESRRKDYNSDNKEERQFRYDKFDYSIITNIASGKAYANKNPNLMSDTLLDHLTKKLEFSSELELLWGDKDEVSNFIKKIFENIILDILHYGNEALKDSLNRMLFDYVPYAEYHSYWEMFIEGNNMTKFPDNEFVIPAYYYQLNEDSIIEQYGLKQINAIKFLYYKFDILLTNIMKDFLENGFKTDDGYSLKKIDKKLEHLVSMLNAFFLENMPNEDSLGLRVRNILISDYKRFGYLIARKMKKEKFELAEYTVKYLVESSLTYVNELKRVQVIELNVIKGYNFSTKEKLESK
ncbi:hypothetical protein M222_2456 [Enterococcus faecalis AZ19]|uniref:hypothetical protein n=1 Tax=Enterococcus faecalis TaxID=1351 RepID=UPI00045A4F3E|nr:hypothetical protein [Enterococcus faecalis]KAJ71266.1 hypothetical protein M222_2456 [Enterococcus faecalis AZ19]